MGYRLSQIKSDCSYIKISKNMGMFFMNVVIRVYNKKDVEEARVIWNTVVEDGNAFPQENALTAKEADEFFTCQTYTAVAENSENGEILGLYILHPNNIGRCGHICNASYAVKKSTRGLHIGEMLVLDCLKTAKNMGFKILQFNAVVASNIHAIHLYERLGFVRLGEIPGGFKINDEKFENIILFYHTL